jgi:hypothetical protein
LKNNTLKQTFLFAIGLCLSVLSYAQNNPTDTPEDFIARFKDVAESGEIYDGKWKLWSRIETTKTD